MILGRHYDRTPRTRPFRDSSEDIPPKPDKQMRPGAVEHMEVEVGKWLGRYQDHPITLFQRELGGEGGVGELPPLNFDIMFPCQNPKSKATSS